MGLGKGFNNPSMPSIILRTHAKTVTLIFA